MRIVLKLLLGLALAGALLLATVPWWLGLALAPLARGQGVVFARYERVGYGRFRLHEVRREDAASVFSATVIEADTPLLWAWQVWRGRESAVAIENWSLVLQQPATSAEQPAPPVNVSTVHGEVVDALTLVGRWLPRAEARRGEVRLPGGAPIGVAAVSWRDGALTVSGGRVHGRELELSLAREAADVLTLRVNSVADAASVRLEWAGEELRGALAWHGQPASLHARFPAQGWIPAEAELRTERWSFPAELLGLQKQYVTIEGGGILRWREGRGTLTGDWRAVPRGNAPAMQVQFAAVGDRAAITVERLRVDAPFAEATLSAPVTIGLVGAVEVPSARLAFRADLGRQTWFDAQGRLEGELAVRERSGLAVQEFRFAGEGLRLAGLEVARASLRGALRWPELTLEQGELVLDSQSEIAVSGSLDLDRRTLADTRVTAKLGETWFRRWLPPELRWSAASIEADLSGPLDELAHRGRATVAQLERPPLRPTTVALEWTGRAQTLDALTATAETGGAALRVVGAANRDGAQLRELRWQRDGAEVLTLAAPATIEWTPEWRVDAVRLDGPGGRLEVAIGAGPQRAFHIAARGLGKALINDWIAVEGPEWTVDSLDANGRTQDGALLFELAGAGNAAVERGRARIEISATGERDGVVVQRLTISDDAGVPLAQASGRVPVMGSSAPALQWRLLRDGQVELQAESRPGSALWPLLAARFGLRLEAPQARLRLEGTVERPQGSLEIDVSRLGRIAGEKESSLPEVENLALRARIERDGLVVESLAASIEGQAVRASARLPVAPHDWARLARKPADFDWREAEATLELPSADLGRLARSIPGFPLAQGRLTVTANLARGGRVTGSLRLVEGASRPLPPVGVLQNVTAEAELAGRAIELRELSAQLGGEAVTLRGRVDLTDFAAPRLALELAGRNVPLARKAGLLLRSDLALSARTDDAGRTRLAGTVELHDGLVLADLQQFIPTGVRGTERPPPYFAVEQAPFRDWTLDVAITGARGVRLHTPVATGFVSPRLRLEGTLGAPLAVGELNLESGRILLPFAGFEVQLGSVRLSREDPYHPQLNLAATSRRYGYDLRLEGRGSVGQPILTLSSVPALTSEQVWLLVMAGQRPDDTAGAAGLADRKRLTALGTYLGRGFFNGSGSDDPDRLTISSGEQLTQQGGETYLVEYLLGRRWSLVGEYDEFDDYNVGVKWRVYQTGGDDERR